jgi:SNF2 family DNA or RNA helicase
MIWKGPECEVGHVALDEAHLNSSSATLFAKAVKRICENGATLVAITGTPFEKSPRKLIPWLTAFWSDDWIGKWKNASSEKKWEKRGNARTQLRYCAPATVLEVSKVHEKLIRKPDTDEETKRHHIRDLKRLTKTLFVQRHGRRSNFFGHPLVRLPPNDHRDITVTLAPEQALLVDEPVRQSAIELKEEHLAAVTKWKRDKRRTGEEPRINILSWLQKCRRSRILSTFPEIAALPETINLALTIKEANDNNWTQRDPKCFYQYASSTSPYEKYVDQLCADENSPKMKFLKAYISAWNPDEKGVFITVNPVTAIILYWFLRILGYRIAIADGKQDKRVLGEMCQLFQSDPTVQALHPNLESPQFIVGTTKLLSVGINLFKATRLVQVEPEWLGTTEEQARGRVSRLGQESRTATVRLWCSNSKVEEVICATQEKRAKLLQLSVEHLALAEEYLKLGEELEDGGDVDE